PAQVLPLDDPLQVGELARRAVADDDAVLQCCDSCRVIASILKSLERIDELWRCRAATQYSDDPAHRVRSSPTRNPLSAAARRGGRGLRASASPIPASPPLAAASTPGRRRRHRA